MISISSDAYQRFIEAIEELDAMNAFEMKHYEESMEEDNKEEQISIEDEEMNEEERNQAKFLEEHVCLHPRLFAILGSRVEGVQFVQSNTMKVETGRLVNRSHLPFWEIPVVPEDEIPQRPPVYSFDVYMDEE